MIMRKLVFIGPIDSNNIPITGDTMKNQLFIERFTDIFDKIFIVDTMNWRNSPKVFIKLILTILTHRDSKIIISASPYSAHYLLRVINFLNLPNDIFYWVVGGSFHRMVEMGQFSVGVYKNLSGIFVQGQSMVETLSRLGLNNVRYVANSKIISHYGIKPIKKDYKTHFVFISRIEEYKGCNDIFASINDLINQGYKNRFDVTFYGRPSEDKEFAERFEQMIKSSSVAEYKGILNLKNPSNYDELASYDCMLFPTYWKGEGFPGVVIDAYISSLPIIATDWNLNKDVIEDGITGWIIPVNDVNALTERMKFVIEHPDEVAMVSKNCRERASLYDSRVVLSESNLKKLGII